VVTRVAIIGCGLIGQKRARALSDSQLVVVADTHLARAQHLAAQFPGCSASETWPAVVERDDLDVIIVATTNDSLTLVTQAALACDKHVLVEKPAARNVTELVPLMQAAQQAHRVVKVGFNHRFHPAFQKARAIFDSGALGPLMYIRARYGHGGRLGYERSGVPIHRLPAVVNSSIEGFT
jgi:predicted dehydrogenase